MVAAFDAAASAHHAQPDDGHCQDDVAHAALEAFEVVTGVDQDIASITLNPEHRMP